MADFSRTLNPRRFTKFGLFLNSGHIPGSES